MANALYDLGRESFLNGEINWTSNNIKCVLVKSTYTPDLAAHQFISDIGASHRVVTSSNLLGKSTTAGVADAADEVLSAVSGDQAVYIVIYQDTGVEATSRLIALLDTATGLPVTPNGNDITLMWDNTSGGDGIFKL